MSEYKIGYSYSPVTGEYIGSEFVYMENATGVYPHASNVVFVQPPEPGEKECPIWDGTAWKLVPDHRGEAWYQPDGLRGGVIKRLGEVSEILKAPPEKPDHMELTWDEDKKDWNLKPASGYIADGDNLREMTQAERIEAGLDPMPDGCKVEDGEIVSKTRDDLFAEGVMTVAEYNAEVDEERAMRYRRETDKMGLMYLRGECTLEDWKMAMDKIRQELPKK